MTEGEKELVYVLSTYIGEVGGSAKATVLLCEALIQSGRRVRLFVASRSNPETVQKLEALGVRVDVPRVAVLSRWAWPSRSLILQLWRAARKEHPAFIHTISLSQEARFLLQLPRVAPVYLWETTEALPHVKFVDQKIARYLHKAAAVFVPSRTVERNARQSYGFRGPVGILPFWVENPPTRATTVHKRHKNFAFVGRMDLDKGFRFLFEAFSQVQKLHPTTTLTVCGGGDVETVRRLAAPYPAIELRGYISDEDYETVIESCDAVVLPSLHEGYPLSLLEACGRGTPLVATTVGSIPEVFDGRACALLVPPSDAPALAAAMTQLLSEDDATYSHRCSDAREVFESLSSPSVVRQRLLHIYSEIERGAAHTLN